MLLDPLAEAECQFFAHSDDMNFASMSFKDQMRYDLCGPNPPSTECMTALYLLNDTPFIRKLISMQLTPVAGAGMFDVAGISQDPSHQFYQKVKAAFDYANNIRISAGFPSTSWPLPYTPPPPQPKKPTSIRFPRRHRPPKSSRRLLWNGTVGEIKEAYRLFYRFSREGMIPFSVGANGEPERRLHTFDPRAGEVLFQLQESK